MDGNSSAGPRFIAILTLAGLLGTSFLLAPASTQSTTGPLIIAAAGDFGSTKQTERNIDLAVARGAQGLLGLGDYNYDTSLRGWNAVVQPLTVKGAWFARGNHDDIDAIRSRMPAGQPQWSILLGGVRVVAIDTENSLEAGTSQHGWLVAELRREPASAAKILVSHRSWWLGVGADHPGTEFPGNPVAMDALVAANGVDLVLAAHEHNYQRTQRNAVPYLVVGTGGQSIDSIAGSDPATVAVCACIGHVLLALGTTQVGARFIDVEGAERDVVNVQIIPTASPTPTGPAFTATFKNVRGSRYWVETDVTANKELAGVDVRVNSGSWFTLTKQNWGSWARSMNVADGSTVEFRARATSGESAQSAAYGWPPAGASPTSSPSTVSPSGFTASFRNVRGNEWWVETEVVSNQALAGVDARRDGGPWKPLVHRSWGSWAESMSAPPGSVIEFRARNTQGEAITSSQYVWPPA